MLVAACVLVDCGRAQSWVGRTEQPFGTFAATYDPSRARAQLAGARWLLEWNGVTWQRSAPLPFSAHAICHDAARRETLAIGVDPWWATTPSTWVFDGRNWSQRSASAPQNVTLVFDPALQGIRALDLNGADHFWNGVAWAPQSAGRPSGVLGPVAADTARGRIVMFAAVWPGWPTPFAGTTWEWDGVSWSQSAPATSPPMREDATLVYDARRARCVLLGGHAATTPAFTDTWEWDGTGWTQAQPAHPHAGGAGWAAWFDAKRDRVVACNTWGGSAAQLEWDGADWTPMRWHPSAFQGNLANDVVRQRLVLSRWDQTWEWDGVDWRLAASSGPVPFRLSPLAPDLLGGCVMFGGQAAGTLWQDTWRWNGISWTQLTPPVAPPPRNAHALAYSSDLNGILLYGGVGLPPNQFLWDTWVYRQGTWTDLTPTLTVWPTAGPCRAIHDPVSFRPWVERGSQLWRWTGQWQRVPSPPAAFLVSRFAHDPQRDRLIALSATGALVFDGTTWQPAPNLAPPSYGDVAMDPLRGTLWIGDNDGVMSLTSWPDAEAVYGHPCGPGRPWLLAHGSPRLPQADFALSCSGVAPGATTLFMVSGGPAALAVSASCTVYVANPVLVGGVVANGSGIARLPVPLPWVPALRGLVVHAQAFAAPPTGGVVFTQGLRLLIGE